MRNIFGHAFFAAAVYNTAFIEAQLAQLIEHQTSNLRAVGSSPTVSKNFSFCILSLSRCPGTRSNGAIQMN